MEKCAELEKKESQPTGQPIYKTQNVGISFVAFVKDILFVEEFSKHTVVAVQTVCKVLPSSNLEPRVGKKRDQEVKRGEKRP